MAGWIVFLQWFFSCLKENPSERVDRRQRTSACVRIDLLILVKVLSAALARQLAKSCYLSCEERGLARVLVDEVMCHALRLCRGDVHTAIRRQSRPGNTGRLRVLAYLASVRELYKEGQA